MPDNVSKEDIRSRLAVRPGFMLRRSAQVAHGLFERGCRDLGLTTGQYDVLFVLFYESEVNQDRLAQVLGLDRSTTGVLAGNLEKKGLIARRVKPDDRRKRILALTPEGAEIFRQAQPIAELAKDKILAPLTEEERATLFALLGRLVVEGDGET